MDLISRIQPRICESGFKKGSSFGIGYSGGIDSTVLLHLLYTINIQEQMQWDIKALHLNHQIRPESGSDAAFCAQQAAALDIAYISEDIDVPALAAENRDSLETAARNARYAFYQRHTSRIVLAHHQDDQAETILFNLIRGTGLRGLGGMQPINQLEKLQIMRPLLEITRADIQAWAAEHDLKWVEDPSNTDETYTRNLIRQSIMPLLKQAHPGTVANITRAGKLAYQGLTALQPHIQKAISDSRIRAHDTEIVFDIKALTRQDASLQPLILAEGLSQLQGRVNNEAIQMLQELILRPEQGTVALDLGLGILARREYQQLYITTQTDTVSGCPEGVPIAVPGITACLDQLIEISTINAPAGQCPDRDNPLVEYFDTAALPEGEWRIRTRRKGDRFQPLGMDGQVGIQDLLTDRKIPQGERDRVLILEKGGVILWVTGMRRAAAAALSTATQQVVRAELIRQ